MKKAAVWDNGLKFLPYGQSTVNAMTALNTFHFFQHFEHAFW